jgi:hypothetical protein
MERVFADFSEEKIPKKSFVYSRLRK